MNQTTKINWHDHSGGKATVLACMDPRFAPESLDIPPLLLAMPELGKPDVIRLAGVGQNLINPEHRAGALHSINLSIEAHGSGLVVLYHHYDCGAYGSTKKCGDGGEAERKFHATELKKAREVLRSFLVANGKSDVAIKLAYLDEDTEVVIIEG